MNLFDYYIRSLSKYPISNWGVYHDNGIDYPFIELAVTGYPKENLTATFDDRDRLLTIEADAARKDDHTTYYQKAIATRAFKFQTYVNELYRVKSVNVKDGLLRVVFEEDPKRQESIKQLTIS